jgi:hypothetical protein
MMGFSHGILKDSLKYIALRYPDFANKWTMDERRDILENGINRELIRKNNTTFTGNPNMRQNRRN